LDIDRNSWTTIRPRLPLPEQSEPFSMPADQRVRLDDSKDISPVEQAGKVSECETRRIGSPARFLFRSTYSPSCLRKNKISAASAARGRRHRAMKFIPSRNTSKT